MRNTIDPIYLRNSGFISNEQQQKLAQTRILVAGCGIGSYLAESLLRLGFVKQTLLDGDTIEAHNLNRQNYCEADIGELKVKALQARLRSISKQAEIQAIPQYLAKKNSKELVAGADLIVDTIDFLDLGAITSLHDEANAQGKTVISAWSSGFGAFVVVVKPRPGKPCWFREIFGLGADVDPWNLPYGSSFAPLAAKLAPFLNEDVAADMVRVLEKMKDRQPCPASHVSPGASTVASLVTTLAFRVVAGLPMTEAPNGIHLDLVSFAQNPPQFISLA